MKNSIQDREFSKFRDGKTGDAVAVTFDGDVIPVETSGVDWDIVETTFPALNQDLYTYKKNGLTVQTVLVTYQSNDKKIITQLQKTRY